MKHPKRFCVSCDQNMPMVICQYTTFSMYHCRECGEEICRVGDGDVRSGVTRLRDGLDAMSIAEDMITDKTLWALACEYPEVLSDEHTLWLPENDEDAKKEVRLRKFVVAFNLLTPRQKEVVLAVEKYETHDEAARILGISRPVVTKTLKQIQKRLIKSGYEFHKEGQIGKLTQGDNNVSE